LITDIALYEQLESGINNSILTKNYEYLPILLVSATFQDLKNSVKKQNPGTIDYIILPLDADELLFKVNAIFATKATYTKLPLPYQNLDENGYFLDVNTVWLKTLGYQKEEIIGKNFSELLHPDWVPAFKENFSHFKRNGTIQDLYFRMKHKHNYYIDVLFDGYIETNYDGSFRKTYCIFKDISKLKEAEHVLKESEDHFRTIFHKSPFGIALSDPISGQIYEVNARFAEITGRTRDGLVALNWQSITHPDDMEKSWENQERVNIGDLPGFSMEKRFVPRWIVCLDCYVNYFAQIHSKKPCKPIVYV